jgi:AraC-like DNA-binding protein
MAFPGSGQKWALHILFEQNHNMEKLMKLIDNTAAVTRRGAQTLFSRERDLHAAELATGLKIEIAGVYSSLIGQEWDSGGRKESHYLHGIDIPLSGRRQVVWGEELIEVRPGHVYFWPGNTPLERRCRHQCATIWLTFRCEWLPRVDPVLDWSKRRPCELGPYDPTLLADWQAAAPEISARSLYRLEAQVRLWLAQAIPDFDIMIANHLSSHKAFMAAFELMERQLGADLRIESLAAAQGVNVDAFSRAFKRNTGLSPKEYLNRRLNQEALGLVSGTDLRVKEIASRLRFANEFYFSRFFRKMNGVSPLQFRERFACRGERG